MALLSRSEFGKLVGKTRNLIAYHVSKNKLLETETETGKKLDTTEPINRAWLHENGFSNVPKHSEYKTKTISTHKPNTIDVSELVKDKKTKELIDWDVRKKEADTILQEKKIESEQLKIDKLAGELMPIDLVQKLITINIQNVYKIMTQNHDRMASKYCSILAPGNREMISKIRDEMDIMLNDVVDDTKDTVILEIEKLIHTFSATRTKGQRK